MTDDISLRPFDKLGGADQGWLNTRHHFSFGGYYDRNRMKWGSLRVINDDIIAPGTGFGPHPHSNMEIISYINGRAMHPATDKEEGGAGIQHHDTNGNQGITTPGDVQVMSVGRKGVMHSEYHSELKGEWSTNLFQIWIAPDNKVEGSTWGMQHFPEEDSANKFAIFASGFEEDQQRGALPINSFSRVAGIRLEHSNAVNYNLEKDRLAYAVVLRGQIKLNGIAAKAHDGIAIKNTEELRIESVTDEAEILLVDTHP